MPSEDESSDEPDPVSQGAGHVGVGSGPDPTVGHDPVLLSQTLAALFHDRPRPPRMIIDCTLGRGGHSLAIARALGPAGTLVALDADPNNLVFARERLEAVPADRRASLRFFQANFARLDEVLDELGSDASDVDGILADLGISTNQLFDPRYGMGFSSDGPLDMRFDPDQPYSAADVVNRTSEKELADLIYNLADERHSRRIARKIVEARSIAPIQTTRRLAEIVRSAVPVSASHRGRGSSSGRSPGKTPIDPATRTFMALRMRVNREVESLQRLLDLAPRSLAPGGRLAIISFQSTEDRLVKQAFRHRSESPEFVELTRKPIAPDDDEVHANPRSRSAKLRVLGRVDPQAPVAARRS